MHTDRGFFFEGKNSSGLQLSCQEPLLMTSTGVFMGGNPLHYSFPVFMAQLFVSMVFNRSLVYILKPLHMPRVVSEITAGIMLGPSGLGSNENFLERVFPTREGPLLAVCSYLGLQFFHFKMGVQQDPLAVIKASGRKGFVIAAAGIFFPIFISTSIMALTHLAPPKLFVILTMFSSMTSFIVIANVLAELKLLNSEIGKLALSASMLNDLVVLLLSSMIFASKQRTYALSLVVIVSYIFFFIFLVYTARWAILWVIRRTPEGKPVEEVYITIMLGGVLACGFVGDALGVGPLMGPLVLGLVTPSGPPLGSALVDGIDHMFLALFLPVFFTLCGMKARFSALGGVSTWGLVLAILLGLSGKLVGTVLPCLFYKMSLKDSFLLGLLMNTKGIIEMNAFKTIHSVKEMDDETYIVLVLSLLVISAIISPIIGLYYNPQRNKQNTKDQLRTIENTLPGSKLGILACIHGPHNVPTLINLIQLIHPAKETPISLYPLQLLDLTAQAAPLLISHSTAPSANRHNPKSNTPAIFNAFQNFVKCSCGSLSVEPFTAIAPLMTIDQEICNLAEAKKVTLVVLPFHKQQTIDGTMEETNLAFRTVNRNVLDQSSCSVGILIDRGFSNTAVSNTAHHVGMLFIGGVDDREALALVARMAEHPLVSVTVLRLIPCQEETIDGDHAKLMARVVDEAVLNDFELKTVNDDRITYKENAVKNVSETVGVVKSLGNSCHLLVVGRGSGFDSPLVAGLQDWADFPELGTIGDLLGSSDVGVTASVLVVQQHNRCMVYGSQRGSRLGLARPRSDRSRGD